MKKLQLYVDDTPAKGISPLQFGQVVTGLEMDDSDELLLHYMQFLSALVPTHAISFIHVVPELILFRDLFDGYISDTVGAYAIDDIVLTKMTEKINRYFSDGPKMNVDRDVVEGKPLEVLLRLTDEMEADLVVIGQKSDTKSHGVTAKMLARRIKCNALIVPDKARHKLDNILVPVDFSPHSVKALRTAIALKKQLKTDSKIVCLNVYELPNFAAFEISRTREQFRQMIEADRQEAFAGFLHTHFPEEKEHIQTVVLNRELPWIPHYIMEYAQAQHMDMIVIGAKGHSKIERLFLGSVTENLLARNNSIPTLVVK